jgi:hypothetical protein
MKHAINDKRQHSLSPYARLTVWRANNRQVGYRKVMRRVKKLFSGSGMTFEQLEQFTRSRSGRRHLKNLVYRATREHYLSIGRPLSYAVERARTARLSAGQMLKQLGLDLNMRDEYTYDALKMKPRKDTRPASLGAYVPAKNTPVLYAPSRSGIGGVFHYRKPGGGDVFNTPDGNTLEVEYFKRDILETDSIRYSQEADTRKLWENTPEDTE